MSGTEVAQRTPQQQLVTQIRSDQFKGQVALALPENVTPDRFTRIAITALQASPNIVDCDHASIIRALLQSAAMGLMPDGREAALVPFKGKAQLVPMIAGYRHIAADYGWTIYTAVAYANDEFEYEQGLDVRFRHVPVRPGRDRGEPIAAYAVGKHQDGRRELEVLTVDEVEKVRAVSQTSGRPDSPWANWWEQMAEKTAGKRLFKKLPLSEDDKRVRIVRAAVEPGDAAAALYGDVARAAYVPIEGEIVRDTPGVTPADDAAGVGQQAAGGSPSPDVPAAAAAPGPDVDPDPEPEPAGQAAFPIPEQAADEAPGYTVEKGSWKGRTVAQIADTEQGVKYLGWVMRHTDRVPPDMFAAVDTYVRARLPQLIDGVKT